MYFIKAHFLPRFYRPTTTTTTIKTAYFYDQITQYLFPPTTQSKLRSTFHMLRAENEEHLILTINTRCLLIIRDQLPLTAGVGFVQRWAHNFFHLNYFIKLGKKKTFQGSEVSPSKSITSPPCQSESYSRGGILH